MIKKSIASILIVLLLINSIGCYSYNQIKKEDTEKLEEEDKVKITTLDDKVYYLYDVKIQGSTLKGYRYKNEYYYRSYLKESKVEEVVIPVQQIKIIEIDKFNLGLTTLTMVLIIGIPIAVIAIIVATSEWD